LTPVSEEETQRVRIFAKRALPQGFRLIPARPKQARIYMAWITWRSR
jgi:hypothetical protein